MNIHAFAGMNSFGQGVSGPRAAKATGFDRGVGADMNKHARTSSLDVSSIQALVSQASSFDVAELAHIKNSICELTTKVEALFALTESVMSVLDQIEENISAGDNHTSVIQLDKQFDVVGSSKEDDSGLNSPNECSFVEHNTLDTTVIVLLKTILVKLNELLQLNLKKG